MFSWCERQSASFTPFCHPGGKRHSSLLHHLTRPEIAHYVVDVTKELADLLGISLVEGRGISED
jgi:hypothetical protein